MPGHFGGSTSSSRDTGSDYGQFDRAVSRAANNPTPSAPSGNGGNNNSGVDPGFQEALRQQAIRQANPVFGDPDPQVDVPPQERDSITSFLDNYSANVRANPLMGGTIGALTPL